ncbi:MAG TPA: hypothetical protein V6D05_07025 [Stenomitos sp.]
MYGILHALYRQPQRALRALLLLAMAWMLGAAGVTHTHAGAPMRTVAPAVRTAPPTDQPTMQAAVEAEDCAICFWKAHTPYTPPERPLEALWVVTNRDYHAAAPRAPPATDIGRPRCRAPPQFLS